MKKLFKYFTLIAFSLITIKNYASDLKFKSVVALTANKNQSNTIMSYKMLIENVGSAVGSFVVTAAISENLSLNGARILETKGVSGMSSNSTVEVVFDVPIKPNILAGNYNILLKLDGNNIIAESNENNNINAQVFELLSTLKVNTLCYFLKSLVSSQNHILHVESDSISTLHKTASWIHFPNNLDIQNIVNSNVVSIVFDAYSGDRESEIVVKRGSLTKTIKVYQRGVQANCSRIIYDFSATSNSNSVSINFQSLYQSTKLEYRPHWSHIWTTQNINPGPRVIANLAQGTKYFFRLSTYCEDGLSVGPSYDFEISTTKSSTQYKSYSVDEPLVNVTRDVNTWEMGKSLVKDISVCNDIFFQYNLGDQSTKIEVTALAGDVKQATMELFEVTALGLKYIKTIDGANFTTKMPSVKLISPEYSKFKTYVVRIFSKGLPGGFRVMQSVISNVESGASTRSESNEIFVERNISIDYCTSPIESNLDLKFSSNFEDKVMLQLFDISGSLVKQEFVEISEGENKLSIDCMYIPSGLYFIKLADKSKKFIKL
jgi:hypothetical protein